MSEESFQDDSDSLLDQQESPTADGHAQSNEIDDGGILADTTERLDYWQHQIKQNVRGSYYTVGQALYRVLHTERLLKTANFIKWANANFGLTRSTAYEYIRAYRIVQLLHAQDPTLPVPSTLSHFRVFNKTKLKDGGKEVCRLWKMILSELPPDSHHKFTAKEVLAKGKEIMERERTRRREHPVSAMADAHYFSGARQLISAPSGYKRERTSRSKHPYLQRDDRDWEPDDEEDDEDEDDPEFARGSHVDSQLMLGSVSGGPARVVVNGRGNGMTHSAGGEPRRNGQSSRSVGGDDEDNERDEGHAPARKRLYRYTKNGTQSEPPALIKIPDRVTVLTVPLLVSLARDLVQSGKFDMSVCPASTPDEARALAAGVALDRQGYCQRWHGRIWGNFSGPFFSDPSETGRFVEAAVAKFDNGEYEEGVFLVNLDFGHSWFTTLLEYPHCFLKQPVAMLLPRTPAQDSVDEFHHYCCMVVYLGNDVEHFVELFVAHGSIPGVNSWCNYSV